MAHGKWWVIISVLFCASLDYSQVPTPIRSVSSLPATCKGGNAVSATDEVVLVTGNVGAHYICSAPNTWTAIAGSGSISGSPSLSTQVVGNGTIFISQGKPHFNVLDRMTCDGTTDASAGMNALLATIGTANSASIDFTSGQCLIGNSNFPANVTKDFSGGGSIKLISSSTTPGLAGFVNGTSAECGVGASCATPALTVTSGNTLVAAVMVYPGFTFKTITVTDSCGNGYIHFYQSLAGQPRNQGIWVASNATAGNCTVTTTANGSLTTSQIIVQQFSGMGPVVAKDGQGASSNSTGTTMSSGAATTTAGSLLIACGGPDHFTAETVTAGAGFTQPAGLAGQTTNGYLQCEYKLSSAGGSVTATANLTVDPSPGSWVYSQLALKVGSATATILGGLVNPDGHQIFYNSDGATGHGAVDFTGNTVLQEIRPEWWGASPSATAAINTPALQAAIYGAFGCGPLFCRDNASGLAIYNKTLTLSGQYSINDELKWYHVIGSLTARFRVNCNNGGITQTGTNKRIIDGQSVAYGVFDRCAWNNAASSTNAILDFDYSGAQGSDLRPQFLDLIQNSLIGNSTTDVGVLIAKSGGGAQGSNIQCYDCAAQGFTGAAWQVGGNNTGRNAGRNYALNALAIGYTGDIQGSPLYGVAVYGGGYMSLGGDTGTGMTTMENGFSTQTGFDMYCEATQGPCIMDHVRSESRRLIAGNNLMVHDTRTLDQSTFPTPGVTFPVFPAVGSIIKGSTVGGDGHYYKVTNNSAVFGGVGTPSALESATSGSATTIVNSGAAYTVNAFTGFLASTLAGTNIGCYGVITSNTATSITVTGWLTRYQFVPCTAPDATSKFLVEPNWGTQTTSGGMTWADMAENGIEGNLGLGAGTAVLENVDVPGDKIAIAGPNVALKNVSVTRNDWLNLTAGNIFNSGAVNLLDLDVYNRITIAQGGNTRYQIWSVPRAATGGTPTTYSGTLARYLGTKPLIWSCGEGTTAIACNDVWIGGRSNPLAAHVASLSILEFGGMLGRAVPFGTDLAGTDTDITGGPSTGTGLGGAVTFWTSNPGASSATVNAALERWLVSATGHFFAGLDNTYDIGATAANRPRRVYVGTDFVGPIGATTSNTGAFTTLTTSGLLTNYNGISTVGLGVPTQVGVARLVSQTANLGPTTLFTVGANTSQYLVTGTVYCDTTVATATVSLSIGYTDPANQAQTVASGTAACTALGSGSLGLVNTVISAKNATTITYSTTTANSPNYDVRVQVFQLSTN